MLPQVQEAPLTNKDKLITTYLSLGNLYQRYYIICEKLGVKMTNKTIDLISKFCEEKEREEERIKND